MMGATLTSVSPSKEEAKLARASGQRLAPLTRRGRPLTLRVRDHGKEETIQLPAGAAKLLQAIPEDMALGRAVTIVPQSSELTTQQAADVLNVSPQIGVLNFGEFHRLPRIPRSLSGGR